jgi:hypothetical protein
MTKPNHESMRAKHVFTNETAHTAANRAGQNNQVTERNSTALDPLKDWFGLAKPSRERQQKSAWKRSKQRGRIDAYLAAHLALLLTIGLLNVGGLIA